MSGLEKLQCKRCGHTWVKRVKLPLRCPRCNSGVWNKARPHKYTFEENKEK